MDIARIIRTHIASEDSTFPTSLYNGLQSGEIGLLDIVKSAGEYLTSTEDDVRLRGITLLTSAIKQCPKSRINRQATQVLTDFYITKLEDPPVLPPVLEALGSLASLPTFGEGDSTKVYRSVVEHIRIRSYVQSTRFLVYSLIDILLAHHKVAFLKMGGDFVQSWVKMAEGEKDPRNLILCLGVGRVILVEFEIKEYLEDLYDIIFCYFPITFRPPPDDPYGITTDDLKIALRKCMAATPRFAPLAMPLFLEKLGPSLGVSKRDVLQSLEMCVPVYGQTMMLGFAGELWEGLKTEIFYSPDAMIEKDSLQALSALLKAIYPPESIEPPKGVAEDIIKECVEVLGEPEKSKAKGGRGVVGACIAAGPILAAFTISQILPHIFRQFHLESDLTHKPPIILVINGVLQSLRSNYPLPSTAAADCLSRYRDELLSILSEALAAKDGALRKVGLEGYAELVQVPGFLSVEEVGYVVGNINQLVIEVTGDDLREEAVSTLSTISTLSPKSIETITLPLLFSKIPDQAPDLDAEADRLRYKQILATLSTLCIQPALTETLVVRILAKLDILGQPSAGADPMEVDDEQSLVERELSVAFAHSLLMGLKKTVDKKIAEKHLDVGKYFDQIVPRLFAFFVEGAAGGIGGDGRLLSDGSGLIGVLTAALPVDRQQKFAQSLFSAYENGNLKPLVHYSNKNLSSTLLKPFERAASDKEQKLVLLFAAAFVALRSEVDAGVLDFNKWLIDVLQWTLTIANTPALVIAGSHIIASIINKRVSDLEEFLEYVESTLWLREIADTQKPTSSRIAALKLWLWIAKGLVIRLHPKGMPMITRVVDILSVADEVRPGAASALGILADKGGEEALSKANHAVIKLLYKQRLFNSILPTMVAGCKPPADEATQKALLTALGSTISVIPKSLIMADLTNLLPLVLRALSLPDATMRSSLIDALTGLLETDDATADQAIQGQAKTLVESLLVIGTQAEDPNSTQRSRIAALRCLAVIPDAVRYDILHPVKQKVLRELGKALDDPKRRVRKEAVDTRAKWYRYGAAT